MIWRQPGVLWFGGAILAVLVGIWILMFLLRQRTLRRLGPEKVVRTLIRGRSVPFRIVRAMLFGLGFALLALALAEPHYGSRTVVIRNSGVDVVVALDFSKSMLAQDVRPNRIDRAKAELSLFFEEMSGHRIGVVAFAGETMEFPMTTDYAAINLFLRDLGPMDMPVGGTAIGRALTASRRLLDRSVRPSDDQRERDRIVILMTDGEDHEGDPLEVARELGEAGIKVFTIGIGSRDGQPIPTYAPDGTWTGYMRDDEGNVVHTALTAENEAKLREMAELTGGKYFRARQGGVGVEELRAEMAKLRQTEQDARRVTEHEPRFELALIPAFLLLLFEGLLPEAWIRRRRKQVQVES